MPKMKWNVFCHFNPFAENFLGGLDAILKCYFQLCVDYVVIFFF